MLFIENMHTNTHSSHPIKVRKSHPVLWNWQQAQIVCLRFRTLCFRSSPPALFFPWHYINIYKNTTLYMNDHWQTGYCYNFNFQRWCKVIKKCFKNLIDSFKSEKLADVHYIMSNFITQKAYFFINVVLLLYITIKIHTKT